MPLVWINHELIDKNEARISLFDHGLLHGDGIQEGMRLYGGRVFLLAEHLAMLWHHASRQGLSIPLSSEELASEIRRTCEANSRQEGYVRVIVTRGPGTLALDPRKCEPSVIIIVDEIGLYPRELVDVGMHVMSMNISERLPWSGSLSRGSLVPLRAQTLRAGYCEALLFEPGGRLCGAIESVPFLKVLAGWFVSPSSETDADPVYRRFFLDLLRHAGQPIIEDRLPIDQLSSVQEAFLVAAAVGIVPIDQIDQRPLERPVGPVTRELRQAFRDRTILPP